MSDALFHRLFPAERRIAGGVPAARQPKAALQPRKTVRSPAN
jgi:hypothetical protein